MAKLMAVAGVCSLIVLGAAVAVTPGEGTVQITDKGFVPDRLEVTVGQKVVWQNLTLKDHTVTAKAKPPGDPAQEDKDKPLFDSGLIKPGASWEYIFTKEGSFDFTCRMEKSMTGTIVVKAAK